MSNTTHIMESDLTMTHPHGILFYQSVSFGLLPTLER